jgi:ABC-2 type transport system ATP-binding protein
MTAIEAAGLSKAFGSGRAAGRVQALDGLGLSVPRGTVCALLGPNGAGKTTAVRILATPRVLFLDEPTTGLDPRSRAEIWSAVRALADDGTTILLTTQYLDEADQLAGQIVIIDQGQAVAQGTPDELKDTLGSRIDVVVADPDDLPAAAAVVQRLTPHPPAADKDRRRLSTPVAAGAVTLPELVRQLDAAGVAAEDVSLRRPTLDEVFDRPAAGGLRPAGHRPLRPPRLNRLTPAWITARYWITVI